MRGPIYLVGLMASGKSTVGRLLARRLGLAFTDLDGLIARREGRSVKRLFSELGEAGFRRREARALVAVAKREDQVVATGGGVVLLAANRKILRRGACVQLRLPLAAIARRLRDGQAKKRPLLQGQKPLQVLRALARQRAGYYRASAHFKVSALGKAGLVAQRIEKRLKQLHLP